MNRRDNGLQIEILESRVMLAATDSLDSSVDLAEAVVVSDGRAVDLHLDVFDQWLILEGPGNGSVTVDLGKLPPSVINLQISSFTDVNLIGEATLEYLVVQHVNHVDAGKVDLNSGLFAKNVERLRIDNAPFLVALTGDQTVFEAAHFSTAANSLIMSELSRLGIKKSDPTWDEPETINVLSIDHPEQTILLNFQPDEINFAGIASLAQASLSKEDFESEFIETRPSNPPNNGASSVDDQHTLVANLVTSSSLLQVATVQMALAEASDSGLFGGVSLRRDQQAASLPLDPRPSLAEPTGLNEPSEAAIDLKQGDFGQSALEPTISGLLNKADVSDAYAAPAWGPIPTSSVWLEVDGPSWASIEDPTDTPVSTTIGSVLRALAGPIGQVVLDLQHQLTSFAALVSDQVSDHLRVDHQSPLLVDARPNRTEGNSVSATQSSAQPLSG